MKISNPSVTLKDGLWYGYTVEVPEEPDYCTMTECDPYELCGCRKNKIYYEESLDSANASLVKIRNQEEVSRIVLTSRGCSTGVTIEDLKKSVHRRLSELDVYKLDGYVMEVTQSCGYFNSELTGCDTCGHDCYKPEKTATISPIQKHNTSMKTIYIDSLGTIKACTKEVPETLHQIKDTAVEFEDQGLIFHHLWYQTDPKISCHDFKSSIKRDTFYCVDAEWKIVEQRWSDDKFYEWIDTSKADRFYEMGVKRRVARLVAKEETVAPDNQEELWRAVSKEINEEGLWQYEDWDGFKLTEKGIHYLKEQFTITRKP